MCSSAVDDTPLPLSWNIEGNSHLICVLCINYLACTEIVSMHIIQTFMYSDFHCHVPALERGLQVRLHTPSVPRVGSVWVRRLASVICMAFRDAVTPWVRRVTCYSAICMGFRGDVTVLRCFWRQLSTHPFDAGWLPLSYRDNPGVNGVSHRGFAVRCRQLAG